MRSLPLAFYQEQNPHVPFKVSLFARLHELQALVEELAHIAMLPKPAKERWLNENEALLRDYLDDFTQRASVDGMALSEMDTDTSRLLMEYTQYLQELMHVMDGVFSSKKKN